MSIKAGTICLPVAMSLAPISAGADARLHGGVGIMMYGATTIYRTGPAEGCTASSITSR